MNQEPTRTLGGARVRIGYWIGKGWDWFVEEAGLHVLIALIPVLLIYTGFIVFLVGPVSAGLALVGLRKVKEGRIDFKDFVDGFSRHFIPALLSGVLICVFSLLGLVFLIVPGLVIMAMYQFTFHFIEDGQSDFWSAMESSRKVVANDYFGFTAFIVILLLINLLGVAFLFVGLAVTLPMTTRRPRRRNHCHGRRRRRSRTRKESPGSQTGARHAQLHGSCQANNARQIRGE